MTPSDPDIGPLIAVLSGRPFASDLTGADWENLLALALSHDLAPFVYSRLKNRGINPPAAIAAALRQAYYDTAARNIRRFDELGKVLAAMDEAGIPIVLLKGAALAEAVYGDIALRPMFDADLMVKPVDVARAIDVLRAMGYEPDGPLDPVAEQTLNHAAPFSRPGGFRVDLHWTILTPRHHAGFGAEDLAMLWSRAERVNSGGVSVLMCSPTDLLLHLSMHVSVGHWFHKGLLAYVDIAEVTRRYGGGSSEAGPLGPAIDWQAFSQRANKWGVANGVRLALHLAAEWTGLIIPAHVLPALNADPLDDETVEWARHKTLHGSELVLQSEAAQLAARVRFGGYMGLVRDAIGPFRTGFAGLWRAPSDSVRSSRDYSSRLIGYLGRNRLVLWRLATRDKVVIADSQNEARLGEYLRRR